MKKDHIIPAACVTVIIISSVMLYIDFSHRIEHASAAHIGTITFKKKIAERKYTGEIIWEDVKQNAPIYNFDTIRTSSDSLSIIKFKDKTELEIGENTFIYLNWTKAGAKINFTNGSISARNTDSTAKLNISSGDNTIEMEKGQLQLSKHADTSLKVNVSSGSAVIKTKKGTTAITDNKGALITDAGTKVVEKTVKLLKPMADSFIVTHADQEQVIFNWKTEKNQNLLFEISSIASFASVIQSHAGPETVWSSRLIPGTYYWRVRKPGTGQELSETRKFVVLHDTQTKPLNPASGAKFASFGSNPIVSFNWVKGEIAASYEVIIGSDPGMKNIILKLPSQSTSIATDKLGPGTYYWTVVSTYDFGNAAPKKNTWTSMFNISISRTIPTPEVISPRENEEVSALGTSDKPTVFNWDPEEGIAHYEVKISTDKEGKKPVVKSETSENFYSLTNRLPAGTYYFTVTGLNTLNSRGQSSPPRAFRVTGLKKIVLGITGEEVPAAIQDKNGITLKWNDSNSSGNYLVQIAADRQCTSTIAKKYTKEAKATFTEKIPHPAFWKVSLLDKNKNIITSSDVVPLVFGSTALEEPEIIFPRDNQKVDMTIKDTITFSWKRVPDATLYNIKIYHTKGGAQRLIYQTDTRWTEFTLKKLELLDKGVFTLEIQGITDYYKKITRRSPLKRSTFNIILQEPDEKPEIISPNTLYVQ